MLVRSERLTINPCLKNQNEFVGPNSYVLDSPRDCRQEAVPFRFKVGHRPLQKIVCNPAPNQYVIKYRKHRIIGGNSLRYTEARKTRELDTTGPSPTTHRIFETRGKPKGNIYRGPPPRYGCPNLSSGPSYQIPDGNPRFKKKRISYYTREPNIFARCEKYKGPKWSLSKSDTDRFKIKEADLPGPADYDTTKKGPTIKDLWDYDVRLNNIKNAKLKRLVQESYEKQKRENLPGPFDTFVDPDCFKKKSFNVKGTFTKEERMRDPICSDEPSPQSFNIKSTFGVSCLENKKRPPFNITSTNKPKETHPVGPADYNPNNFTIGFKLCQKLPVGSAGYVAPFGTSEPRSFPVCNKDFPSPLDYDARPIKKIRFCEEPPGVLDSKSSRFPDDNKTCTPSPLHYEVEIPGKCDHSKIRYPFNSTSRREFETDEPDYLAAPNSYNATKDGVLPKIHRTIIAPLVGNSIKCKRPTPGPDHYDIHPLYGNALIKAYTTHNVTFAQKDVFNTKGVPGPRLPKKVLNFFVRSAASKRFHQSCF